MADSESWLWVTHPLDSLQPSAYEKDLSVTCEQCACVGGHTAPTRILAVYASVAAFSADQSGDRPDAPGNSEPAYQTASLRACTSLCIPSILPANVEWLSGYR